MTVKRISKGYYNATDTCFKGVNGVSEPIYIIHDAEAGFWYAEDSVTGQSVVDCERTLHEIKDRIDDK